MAAALVVKASLSSGGSNKGSGGSGGVFSKLLQRSAGTKERAKLRARFQVGV